jgi:branched-chain amino acid transport system permease protein
MHLFAALFLGNFDFWISVGVLAGTYAVVALGIQLNVGYTGILNFGAAGFMAIGAYTVVILILEVGMPFLLACLLGMVVSIIAGLIIGLPSLRLRADYFAIVSIGIAEMIRYAALNLPGLTGGTRGLFCEGSRCWDDWWASASKTITGWIEGLGWQHPSFLTPLLIVTWVIVVVVALALSLLQRTPWGRVVRAIREDEDAALALGKNTFVYKLQSLSIASALGALGGLLLAMNLSTVNPEDFKSVVTFYAYGVLILGGLASYWGVIVGSIIFWSLMEATRFVHLPFTETQDAAIRFALVGVILVAVMTLRPQGLLGNRKEMVLGE